MDQQWLIHLLRVAHGTRRRYIRDGRRHELSGIANFNSLLFRQKRPDAHLRRSLPGTSCHHKHHEQSADPLENVGLHASPVGPIVPRNSTNQLIAAELTERAAWIVRV